MADQLCECDKCWLRPFQFIPEDCACACFGERRRHLRNLAAGLGDYHFQKLKGGKCARYRAFEESEELWVFVNFVRIRFERVFITNHHKMVLAFVIYEMENRAEKLPCLFSSCGCGHGDDLLSQAMKLSEVPCSAK